jgi:hypothetical protein
MPEDIVSRLFVSLARAEYAAPEPMLRSNLTAPLMLYSEYHMSLMRWYNPFGQSGERVLCKVLIRLDNRSLF